MKHIYKFLFLFAFAAFTFMNSLAQLTPQQAVKQMTRGINIGNTMESPTEGAWGNAPVQEVYFDDYKTAGFTSVRIPITWDAHTLTSSPYTINAAWLTRVKQVVDWGLERGLIITINAHHEAWLKSDSSYALAKTRDRFDSIWSQISSACKDRSDSLIFEIINEPKGLSLANVNDLNARVLSIIRKTNPTRLVIFSGNEWANSDQLVAATVPDTADHHLIGYYHSYDPYPFGLEGPGTYGSPTDISATIAKFNQVTTWSAAHNIPVILSEFGAQKRCEYNSRMIYYATIVEQALRHGVAFNVWDDGGDFQIMFRSQNSWNDLKDILIYTYKESPTKLKTNISSDKIVSLSWTNRTTDNDSIFIDRKTINSDFTLLAKIAHDAAQYIDLTAKTEDTVFYRLRTRLKDSINLYSYSIKVPVVPSPVAVEQIKNFEGPTIYPNPATDGITVTLKDGGTTANLDVFDILGNHLKSVKIYTAETTVNISGLNRGAYFFKVTTLNTISVKSILIQ